MTGVHTFPKGINSKVDVIAQLEFELCNYDIAVEHASYYTTETPSESTLELLPSTRNVRYLA